MGFTQIGAMPKNQLDALPLYSASSAASGGTVSLGPQGMTRFWSPTILGISGATWPLDANNFATLASNFIDTTGCKQFCVMLTRTNAGVGAVLGGITTSLQYRLSSVDVPPTSFGASQPLNSLGCIIVSNAATVFPAMINAGDVQRSALGFSADVIAQGGNPTGTDVMLGSDIRLLFTVGVQPPATNLFSLTLWGSS